MWLKTAETLGRGGGGLRVELARCCYTIANLSASDDYRGIISSCEESFCPYAIKRLAWGVILAHDTGILQLATYNQW